MHSVDRWFYQRVNFCISFQFAISCTKSNSACTQRRLQVTAQAVWRKKVLQPAFPQQLCIFSRNGLLESRLHRLILWAGTPLDPGQTLLWAGTPYPGRTPPLGQTPPYLGRHNIVTWWTVGGLTKRTCYCHFLWKQTIDPSALCTGKATDSFVFDAIFWKFIMIYSPWKIRQRQCIQHWIKTCRYSPKSAIVSRQLGAITKWMICCDMSASESSCWSCWPKRLLF